MPDLGANVLYGRGFGAPNGAGGRHLRHLNGSCHIPAPKMAVEFGLEVWAGLAHPARDAVIGSSLGKMSRFVVNRVRKQIAETGLDEICRTGKIIVFNNRCSPESEISQLFARMPDMLNVLGDIIEVHFPHLKHGCNARCRRDPETGTIETCFTIFQDDETFDSDADDETVAAMVDCMRPLLEAARVDQRPGPISAIVALPSIRMTRGFADRVCDAIEAGDDVYDHLVPVMFNQIPSLSYITGVEPGGTVDSTE